MQGFDVKPENYDDEGEATLKDDDSDDFRDANYEQYITKGTLAPVGRTSTSNKSHNPNSKSTLAYAASATAENIHAQHIPPAKARRV
eukprot:jgi/Hompol1/1061/HPOL_001745-RA